MLLKFDTINTSFSFIVDTPCMFLFCVLFVLMLLPACRFISNTCRLSCFTFGFGFPTRVGLRQIVEQIISTQENRLTDVAYTIRQTEQTSGGGYNVHDNACF